MKKLFAVTNIKVSSDKSYEADQEINPEELKSVLSMDQIKELFDAGAIKVVDEEDPASVVESSENPDVTSNPDVESHGDQPKDTENPETPTPSND
jgi:hypothetical protein